MGQDMVNELKEKYKLTEEEHNIILQQLVKDTFSNHKIEENPTIMFIIGQPGSGKTTFINRMDLSDYVIINSDNYRKLNKNSDEILEKYPTYYSKLTNYDAHLWGDELFYYGVNKGYSVLREKVPTDLSLIEVLRQLPSRYNIIINVVVTGNIESLLATRERYEKEIVYDKNAKLSNIDSHNKCYDILPQFISACIELGIKVNYVVASQENNRDINIIKPKEDYLAVLEQLREDSNNRACETFSTRIEKIKDSMRFRNASQEEFDELSKIEKIYELERQNRPKAS